LRISGTSIGGVHLVEPEVHRDERGEFWRSFCSDNLSAAGIDFRVVQSNVSLNRTRHTVRGFHYQRPPSREQKILTVVSGAAHVVIVDVRQGSDTRLEHQEFVFEVGDRRSLVVADGCATGFQTLTDDTIVHYQMADIYRPDSYTGFRYDDPTVGVAWPAEPAVISDRDLGLPFLDPDVR
tara:strand:+ start:389 stop:928 length:540 start_codon:yes stop_codon:yes gene_type:complete